MKMILSPCLFSPSQTDAKSIMKNSRHLYDTLYFISEYTQLELDRYENSPYNKEKLYKPNFEYDGLNYNFLTSKVYPLLLKMIKSSKGRL